MPCRTPPAPSLYSVRRGDRDRLQALSGNACREDRGPAACGPAGTWASLGGLRWLRSAMKSPSVGMERTPEDDAGGSPADRGRACGHYRVCESGAAWGPVAGTAFRVLSRTRRERRMKAIRSAAGNLTAGLSWRVATARFSFSQPMHCSTMDRRRYIGRSKSAVPAGSCRRSSSSTGHYRFHRTCPEPLPDSARTVGLASRHPPRRKRGGRCR